MSVPTAIIIVFGEAHLRRILKCYAGYYNDFRTHRSLNKDAPVSQSEASNHTPSLADFTAKRPSLSFRYTHRQLCYQKVYQR
jgi:hypothetical protein